LRQLLSLFVGSPEWARDRQVIRELLIRAVHAGAVARDSVADLLDEPDLSQVNQGEALLRAVIASSGRSLESRIARALSLAEASPPLGVLGQKDPRARLSRLVREQEMKPFLARDGSLDRFEQAVSRTLERLVASDLLRLHSLEGPYLFAELPLSRPLLGRAHVHLLGEGGRGRPFNFEEATVAIDLSTPELGELWISLQLRQGSCRCSFRAIREETAAAVSAHSQELVEALARAGHAQARVVVTRWDGDRARQAAGLLGRLRRVDLTA
jgi:flagellar hook-length control protein FliK